MKQHQKYLFSLLLSSLLLAPSIAQNDSLRIAMLSDVHILPMYDPTVNNTCYCSVGCPGIQKLRHDVASNDTAPLGRLYCDPPQDLTEAVVQKLKLEAPDLDILFVTGDIVGHTYA